jgi:hypothetical protein
MRRAWILLALALGAPATIALADSERPAEVAAALRSEPVFAAPALSDELGVGAVSQLNLEIVHKDIGRVHIAVIPKSWAEGDGGVRSFANDVDQELGSHGALLVVAYDHGNTDAHVVTSHDHATEAATGVQRAFDNERGGLAAQLRRSIDALAEVDPGRSGDLDQGDGASPGHTPTIDFPDPNGIVKDVTHTIKFVVIAIILAVLSPFIFLFLRATFRARRNYEDDKEAFGDDLQAVSDERDKLGEDIVDLDTATSMPNVPPSARAAYEKALDAYDTSAIKLKEVDSRRRLEAVKKLIADGRAAAAQARNETGSGG